MGILSMHLRARMLGDVKDRSKLTTEKRNPRTRDIDRVSTRDLVEMINTEDDIVAPAVRKLSKPIAKAVDLIVAAFRNGGRLLYVGAGTSGRLGVLDASECPPTFGTKPSQVQGIIAGGRRALGTPRASPDKPAHFISQPPPWVQ